MFAKSLKIVYNTRMDAPDSHPALRPVDPLRRDLFWRIPQGLAQAVCSLWLRLEVRGLEYVPTAGAGLLLSNHQSFLDPPLVAVQIKRPVSFVARESLFRIPLFGRLLRRNFTIPINREGAGPAAIREILRRLDEGFLVGLFPEGTRSADGALGEFKPGFAALVRRSRVPIYPAGIAGANRALGRGSWLIRPVRVCVVYGEPLLPAEIEPLCARGREDDLVAAVRARIAECQRAAEEVLLGRTVSCRNAS